MFDAGASFVCIGSMAQQNREKTRKWLETYGAGRVIVGADVRNEHVCIQGWKVETETTIYELIEELYRELVTRYPEITLIASGGVGGMEDIQALENMGISAVIVGKAFYEKNVEFKI